MTAARRFPYAHLCIFTGAGMCSSNSKAREVEMSLVTLENKLF